MVGASETSDKGTFLVVSFFFFALGGWSGEGGFGLVKGWGPKGVEPKAPRRCPEVSPGSFGCRLTLFLERRPWELNLSDAVNHYWSIGDGAKHTVKMILRTADPRQR